MENSNPDPSLCLPNPINDASPSLHSTDSILFVSVPLHVTSSSPKSSSLVLSSPPLMPQPQIDSSDECHLSTEKSIDIQPNKDEANKNTEETANDGENQNKLNESTPKEKIDHRNVPFEGMEFASLESFEEFYYAYAQSEGYNVRIKKTLRFERTDVPRYRHYVCSCAGFCNEKKSIDAVESDHEEKTDRRTLTRRSGCPVAITISKKKSVWKVISVTSKHNHLLVSPNSRAHLRQHGGMSSVAKNLVEKFSESDLPIGRVPAILNDTDINVSQRSCWNHRRDLRKMNLDKGDAEAVLNYCRQKQLQDPNFFYAIQTDDEDRMVNFFWIDSTARQYYERFGDVLVFDTTYKTNKYGMPLANFVGANNHIQSIMFGCALLQNEEEETFVWLFQTWLEAVGGKLPISILTDQDRAIKLAIEKVFPSVNHRFCLWHILKKFPEKYGSLYKDKSPFKRDLKNCLHRSVTTMQFDSEWGTIMSKYKLTDDEWLKNLFIIRQSWVPVYNRTIFYAGMNTTQRCESIHSFFDSFLNKGTTLKEFVIKYGHALEHRYMAEHAERFVSIYKKPILKVETSLEEHAASVYTRNMFNQFQDELLKGFKLKKEKLEKEASSSKYMVSNSENPHEVFLVNLDVGISKNVGISTKKTLDVDSLEVSCQCHLFEFKGILCRHILAIFIKKDVEKIPPQYILPRWTKRAAEGIPIPLFKKDGETLTRDLKFNNTMSRLRPYLHVSKEAFDTIMEALEMTLKKVSNLQGTLEEITKAAIEENADADAVRPLIGDPHISKTKGRKKDSVKESKNGRFKGGIESSKRSKRQCKDCGEFGHYPTTCKRRKQAKSSEPID